MTVSLRARAWSDVALAALVIVLADVLLFHVGVYLPFVKPESFGGRVDFTVGRDVRSRAAMPELSRVVAIGDSTMLAGIDEPLLDRELALRGLACYAFNFSEGALSPRGWVALERRAPLGHEVRVLVVGIYGPTLATCGPHTIDVAIAKSRLSLGDALEMAGTYADVETRLEVVTGAMLRTIWYRLDLRDLLADPRGRRRDLARIDAQRHDLSRRRVVLTAASMPPTSPGGFLPDVPLAIAPCHAERIETLVRHLRSRKIPVVMAVLPLPYIARRQPCEELGALTALSERLEAQGATVGTFAPQELLRELERPGYFQDMAHMNARGARLYTQALAEFLAAWLPDASATPS
ncbi:MAG: hypothetical protein U0166_10625 [Acidobacteriota bacterium]